MCCENWIAKFLLWLWVKPNSWLVFCYCCYKTNMKEKTRPESHRFVEIVEHKKSWYFVWSCTDSFQCFAWRCWWLDLKHTSERSLSKTAHIIMMINFHSKSVNDDGTEVYISASKIFLFVVLDLKEIVLACLKELWPC